MFYSFSVRENLLKAKNTKLKFNFNLGYISYLIRQNSHLCVSTERMHVKPKLILVMNSNISGVKNNYNVWIHIHMKYSHGLKAETSQMLQFIADLTCLLSEK